MKHRAVLWFSAILIITLKTCLVAQVPLITALDARQGTLSWTNNFTNGVTTIEATTNLCAGDWLPAGHVFTVSTVTSVPFQTSTADALCLRMIAADVATVPGGMVLIPSGKFRMGNCLPGDGWPAELPMHSVFVSSFYMDKYEVTNDKMVDVLQWAYDQGRLIVNSTSVTNAQGNKQRLLFLGDAGCRITWDGSHFAMKALKGAGYPCVAVTWYGAVAYCNYRSEMEGRTAPYNFSDWSCSWPTNGYRLPTEAEWEKAARGGTTGHRFPWNDTNTITHSRANYYSSTNDAYDVSPTRGWHPDYDVIEYPYTSPVGSFDPNGYGLYDMAGNVWEWCWDWSDATYYSISPASDPRGPDSGSSRAYRGGSWHWIDNAPGCRVACRGNASPGYSGDRNMGFRTVLPSPP